MRYANGAPSFASAPFFDIRVPEILPTGSAGWLSQYPSIFTIGSMLYSVPQALNVLFNHPAHQIAVTRGLAMTKLLYNSVPRLYSLAEVGWNPARPFNLMPLLTSGLYNNSMLEAF